MIAPGSLVTVARLAVRFHDTVWDLPAHNPSRSIGRLSEGRGYLVLAVVRGEVVILFEGRVGWCMLEQVRETTT